MICNRVLPKVIKSKSFSNKNYFGLHGTLKMVGRYTYTIYPGIIEYIGTFCHFDRF